MVELQWLAICSELNISPVKVNNSSWPLRSSVMLSLRLFNTALNTCHIVRLREYK